MIHDPDAHSEHWLAVERERKAADEARRALDGMSTRGIAYTCAAAVAVWLIICAAALLIWEMI